MEAAVKALGVLHMLLDCLRMDFSSWYMEFINVFSSTETLGAGVALANLISLL